jgi:hypothetical protein
VKFYQVKPHIYVIFSHKCNNFMKAKISKSLHFHIPFYPSLLYFLEINLTDMVKRGDRTLKTSKGRVMYLDLVLDFFFLDFIVLSLSNCFKLAS